MMKTVYALLRQKRGESLVEVLCAMVIVVMLLGVLGGSVSFATNAQHKAESLRKSAAELSLALSNAGADAGGSQESLGFTLSDADGEPIPQDSSEQFRISFLAKEKTVTDSSGKSVSFLWIEAAPTPGTVSTPSYPNPAPVEGGTP